MKKILTIISVYTFITALFAYSVYQLYQSDIPITANFKQELLAEPILPTGYPWSVRSIDTQVITKHWEKVPRESIRNQISLLKSLGVNYIAIATPYNKPQDMKMWADEIHNQGLNVWFRSHWNEWEGVNKAPNVMTPRESLQKTKQFIVSNPTLFKEGDAFTVTVEPEQAGIGLGKKFASWDEYRSYLLNQITTANEGFEQIGLYPKIHTNWLSTNGWVVENVLTQDVVDKLGIIVIDHYSPQSRTIGALDNPDDIAKQMSSDLDFYYSKWKKPIMLGEWGYQIYQDTDDPHQAETIQKVLTALSTKDYLVGMNYWSHMGHHSKIIDDHQGGNLTLRPSAQVLKDLYTATSSAIVKSN